MLFCAKVFQSFRPKLSTFILIVVVGDHVYHCVLCRRMCICFIFAEWFCEMFTFSWILTYKITYKFKWRRKSDSIHIRIHSIKWIFIHKINFRKHITSRLNGEFYWIIESIYSFYPVELIVDQTISNILVCFGWLESDSSSQRNS